MLDYCAKACYNNDMSRNPEHKNPIQRSLYRAGVRSKGIDLANNSPDTQVRKWGMTRMAQKAGNVALVTALSAVSVLHIADRLDGEARGKEEKFQNEQTSYEIDRQERGDIPQEHIQDPGNPE